MSLDCPILNSASHQSHFLSHTPYCVHHLVTLLVPAYSHSNMHYESGAWSCLPTLVCLGLEEGLHMAGINKHLLKKLPVTDIII